MARRMTDTAKWDDEWFMNLSAPTKLLWLYLCDSCDHAGIWKVNRRLAEFKIGAVVPWEDALAELDGRIQTLGNNDRWFICKFVEFQYGSTLSEKNNVHASVLKSLRLHGIIPTPHQPLTNPSPGAQDKDKDKDKDSSEESAERSDKKIREKKFHELLISLTVADGSVAIRKWWAMSAANPLAKEFEARCDLIYWCVKKARSEGVKVQYASDVIQYADKWRPLQEKESA
jgi:hypothetical protein